MKNICAVITTIASPTGSVRSLLNKLKGCGRLVVVGDRPGPPGYETENTDFLSIEDQLRLPFRLGSLAPECHYARKNIGYLYAVSLGAECIYETDDDNAPMDGWMPRAEILEGEKRAVDNEVAGLSGWVNVYRYFTRELIWPRGFPLEAITMPLQEWKMVDYPLRAPIQQGLANHSPDVDAIWRLTRGMSFNFDALESLWLAPGNWCPFNTQSTWWWPDAYPLLYLPAHCSFRMCDIWKSLVAQRCLWEMDCGVVYHPPEVIQERNPHDLMKDFEAEVPGYLNNAAIAETLGSVGLCSGPEHAGENLFRCYEELVKAKFFPSAELELAGAWVEDIEKQTGRLRSAAGSLAHAAETLKGAE